MDHEKFNKAAGGVQSIVLSVAVIVGGGWALYQFHTLQQTDKARLDIEELRSKQPVLNIDLSASTIHVSSTRFLGRTWPEATYLQVLATIQNVGKANTYLDMSGEPLKISRILDPIGTVFAQSLKVGNLGTGTGFVLCRAGSIDKYTFVANIKDPGLYQISLDLPVETSEIRRHANDPAVLEYQKDVGRALDKLPPQVRADVSQPQSDGLSGHWSEKIYYVVSDESKRR